MSLKSAREFIEKINMDENLSKKISNIGNDIKAYVIIAKQEGFDFTADELKDVGDLFSDEQLSQVAGGLTYGLAQSVVVNNCPPEKPNELTN